MNIQSRNILTEQNWMNGGGLKFNKKKENQGPKILSLFHKFKFSNPYSMEPDVVDF